MNLTELHDQNKEISIAKLFQGESGVVNTIHIQANGRINEHSSKVPALLLCIRGNTVYREQSGRSISLNSGDYVDIPAGEIHWLEALEDSILVLMK
jgi:quercetin dioxygenase-like cupin family protein